jgi:hypothetical protein
MALEDDEGFEALKALGNRDRAGPGRSHPDIEARQPGAGAFCEWSAKHRVLMLQSEQTTVVNFKLTPAFIYLGSIRDPAWLEGRAFRVGWPGQEVG